MITVMANCNFPLMRKHGFPLLVAVLLLLAGSLQAQTTLTLPWTHDFESDATGTTAALPSGWTRINDATGTTNYFPYISSSTINSHSGSNYMYCYMSTSSTYAANAYMVLPAVDRRVEMRDVRLRFWARRSSNPAQLYVGVMGNPSQGSTFVPVDTIDLNTEYTCHTVSFEYYTGSGRNLAFCMRRGSAATYYYVDDIEVFMASCFPVPDNVSAVPQSETSMQLSWHSPGNPRSWKVFYAPTGSTATPDSTVATTNPTVVTGLMAGTEYRFSVAANCANGTRTYPSSTVEAVTPCFPIATDSLPYTYGFEDATASGTEGSFSLCYHRNVAGTTTAYPYPNSNNKHSGTYGCYFYNTAGNSTYSWLVMPRFENSLNVLQLSFWAYKTSANYGHLIVGVMDDPDDFATFVGVDTIQVGAVSTWEYYEVTFHTYTGSGRYIAFAARANATSYVSIDDLTVDILPACPRPTNLAAENVTPHSFDFTWHNNAMAYEYEVEYVRKGSPQGAGISMTVYDTIAPLTGLTLGTSYDCYVRAICGSDTSTWNAATFVTGCDSLRPSDLPYSEDFEAYGDGTSYPLGPCWHKMNNYSYPNSTSAINGVRGLYLYAYGTSYSSFVTLPVLSGSLPVNTLQLEFLARRYTTVSNTYHSKLVVGVATSPTSATGFHPIDTIDLDATPVGSVHSIEVQFSRYTGSGRYIAFYVPYPGSSNYNYIYVDDVVLRRIPTCYRPQSARAVVVAYDEATLEWTPDSRTPHPAGGYQVEYGPRGFRQGTGMTEYSTDTTVTLTNLASTTEYDAYISSICGTELSDPRMVTFRTTCAPIATDSLPYVENFDSYPASTAIADGQTLNPCWAKGTNNTPANPYPYLYTTYYSSAPNCLYFYATAAYYSYVALPAFEADIDQLVFSFDLYKTVANYGHVRVGVMSNPNDISTFTTLAHAWPTDIGDWERFTFDFPDYTGDGRYLALLLPDSIVSYAYLDNISVSYRSGCPTPQSSSTAVIGSDRVVLVWSNDSLVTSWDVYWNLPGFALDTTPYETVTDTTVTIYNLSPDTEYEYVIVASCSGEPANPTFPVTFRTACAAVPVDSLPYVETFDRYPGSTAIVDGQTLSTCWRKGTNYSAAYPFVYSGGYSVSFPNSMLFYTTTTYYNYAVLPIFDTALSALQVRFDLIRYSMAYSGKLTVGVMTDPSDISTFTPVRTCYPNVPIHRYATFEVPLGSYTGNGRYIAFLATNDTNNYAQLDNVVVELVPPCRRSENLVSTDVTAHGATLRWSNPSVTAPTGYQVAYSTQAYFNPDTCHALVSVPDTHARLTSLLDYTPYYWVVRALCGSDTGRWSEWATFSTQVDCGPNGLNIVDTIGHGTTAGTSYTMYCSTSYSTGYSRNIFTVDELVAMGVYEHNHINNIALHTGSTSGTIQNVSIYMVETDLDEFSSTPARDTVAPANMTRVFHGTITFPANSWVTIPFDTVFPFSGNRGIMVTLARNGAASANVAFYYTSTSPDYRTCYGYRNSSTTVSNTANRTYYRTDMVFNLCTEVPACERPANVALAALQPNGATVTWSGDAPRYEVAYGVAGFNPDTVASLAGTHAVVDNDSVYTFTGLTPQTGYDLYVRSLCSTGDTSMWSRVLPFTTPCTPRALPFTENFESYASGASASINSCWTKGTNNSTEYPYPETSDAVAGDRSLYFYAAHTSTTTYYSYAALPLMNAPIDSLMLSFRMRRYATVSDMYTTRMVVGVMTDPSDIATFTPVDTIDFRYEEPGAIHTIDVLFTGYHGSGRYIAFYDEVPPFYGTATSCYSYAHVDDIRVDIMPSCQPVYNVTVADSTLTAATAVVDWVDRVAPVAGYELEYGPQGFLLGTGTTATSATRPVTLTGLASGTRYDVYVRALCSAADTSPWSSVAHFTTVCSPKVLPYTENFEAYGDGSSYTIDPCWNKGTNSTSVDYPHPNAASAINGTRSLFFYSYHPSSTTSTATYSYAVLPLMAAPVDSLQMTFNMRRYNSTSPYYTSRLVVGLMTNPHSIATFTPVDTIDLFTEAVNSVHGVEVSFAGHANRGQYIALYAAEPPLYGTNTYSYNYVHVDDIRVDYIPTCTSPANVTVPDSTLTATTAEVRWTDRSAHPLGYEVEYGPAGFAHGHGTVVAATSQPVALTGLMPATQYEVYVRVVCSAADTSEWSFVTDFTTLCQPLVSLPVVYDFEGMPSGSSSQPPVCWNRLNNGTTYNNAPYINNAPANAHSGNNSLYWYLGTAATYGDYAIMVLPEVDTAVYPVDTWEMSFWGKGTATASFDHRITVGVMTDPDNPATFVGVATFTLTSDFVEYRVSYANYTGRGTYPAFRKNRGTSTGYAYVDDITLMRTSPCPRPYRLEALASTATTATLAWQDTIGATVWDIAYRADGDTTDRIVTATSNPFVLTGLTPITNYQFQVAAHCPNSTQTGDYSIESYRFATSQVPDTVPVFYDFETAGEWAAWQTASNNAVSWYRGSVPYAVPGRHAIYLSADSGATRSTDMNDIVNACVYRDIDFGPDTGSFTVTFRLDVGGTQNHSYDGLSVLLVDPQTVVESSVEGLTSPWGHINSGIALTAARRTSGWTTVTAYIDRICGVKRLVFYWFNQATGSADFMGLPPAIDSVAVNVQECPRPSGLTAEAAHITPISARVQWLGPATGTEYVVAYREVGAAANTNRYDTVTANYTTLTGLNANTGYNVWVRRRCDNTHSSDYSNNYTFYTSCHMLNAGDTLRENFESVPAVDYNIAGGQLPDCWEGYSNGMDSRYFPHVTGGGSYNYTVSGTKAITLTSGSGAAQGDTKIVRLPRFAEPISSLTLSYWFCTEGASQGTLSVGYMTGYNYETDFVPVRTRSASSATQHNGTGLQSGHGVFDTVTFASVPDSALFIAFKWYYNSTFYSACIDNIEVSSSITCLAPPLMGTPHDYESVTLMWSGSTDDCEVAITAGPWNSAIVPVATGLTGTSYRFAGLQPATTYTVGVRQRCDSMDVSLWSTAVVTTDSLGCLAPDGLTVAALSNTAATFTWTPRGNETAWDLHVFNTIYDTICTVTATSVSIGDLTAGVTYYAAVRALCGHAQNIEGIWSDTLPFTTQVCPTVTEVVAEEVTFHSVTLSWPAIENAQDYEIVYGVSGFNQGNGTLVTTTTNSFTVTDLLADTSYDFYVRAICGTDWQSENWSPVVTVETPGNPEGVEALSMFDSRISISPNPTDGSTTISVSGINGSVRIDVVDINGRVVRSGRFSISNSQYPTTFDVENLRQGAYFVHLTGAQVNVVKKLIVR